jgi:dephospho-CoA kinase
MRSRRIGIAGFIGSGKSTLVGFMSTEYLKRSRRVEVIDADYEAKLFMQKDSRIKEMLAETFGKGIITEVGIDYGMLGDKSFETRKNLIALNQIVHPKLTIRLKEMIFSCSAKYILCDAALIPLWHAEEWFDEVVWVHAPFDLRLKRLLKRTTLSRKQIINRMELQQGLFDEPSKAPWKIIDNCGSIDEIKMAALSRKI